MRVIAGRFKGFALSVQKKGTRPTTDRTKEAIFSHLESHGYIDEAHVLDLFAGSGALGIEALSRGARSAVFVDASAQAAGLLRKTIAGLTKSPAWNRATMAVRVLKSKAETVVAKFAAEYRATDSAVAQGEEGVAVAPAQFSLVFLDPPYEFSTADFNALMAVLASSGALSEDAIIVAERSVRSEDIAAPAGWEIDTARAYGETEVFYITRCAGRGDADSQEADS